MIGNCNEFRTYDVDLNDGVGRDVDVWQPDDFIQMPNGSIAYIEAKSCVRLMELGYVDTLFGMYGMSRK